MTGALLVSLKPTVLVKGKNMSKGGQNVPKRHKDPSPGTLDGFNHKRPLFKVNGHGTLKEKHQRVSA